MFSILAGVVALSMASFGYIALYEYVKEYSTTCGYILLISFVLLFIAETAHHVFCGAVEWFYIRMGRTEEARKAILEFFKKTLTTMYVCYIGFLLFTITIFFIKTIFNFYNYFVFPINHKFTYIIAIRNISIIR